MRRRLSQPWTGKMGDFWIGLFVVGFSCAFAVYLVALSIRLMAVVDLIWTAGLGLSVLAYLLVMDSLTIRACVIAFIVVLWSSRLSFHLLKDRIWAGKEDSRYAHLLEYWGNSAKRNFFVLFLFQVVLVALFFWPISVAIDADVASWTWADTLGVIIALVALTGESAADRQLAHFRAQSKNKTAVCRDGLWRYSRHPNYFFEWLHWWAYVAFALSTSWWWALVGPAGMYLFLRYLTGIPHAERSSLKSRGEAYRSYQESTNVFFPWIPHERQS